MAGLITGHEREHLGHGRVGSLQAAAKLLVQQEPRELGRAGALQKLDKDLPHGALDLLGSVLERLVTDEVLLVVVLLELREHRVQLGLTRQVDNEQVDVSNTKGGIMEIEVRKQGSGIWGRKVA